MKYPHNNHIGTETRLVLDLLIDCLLFLLFYVEEAAVGEGVNFCFTEL